MCRRLFWLCVMGMLIIETTTACWANTIVQFDTDMGSFRAELFDDDAPATVSNFLQYVVDGDYQGSVIHRSIPGFVIQGGGWRTVGSPDSAFQLTPIPTDPPIGLELEHSNLRGTLAMARTSQPTSATSQWFINLQNNVFLDTSGGGYAVFGQIVADDMAVVDAVAGLATLSLDNASLTEVPVENWTGGPVLNRHLVSVSKVRVVPEPTSHLVACISLLVGGAFARIKKARRRQQDCGTRHAG